MNVEKRILTFAMLFALSLSSVAGAETVLGSAADVSVAKYEPYPAEPARYMDLWVQVQNNGLQDTRDFFVEFLQNFPFTLESGADSKVVLGTIPSGSAIIRKFRFFVDENAPHGTAELNIRYGTETLKIDKTLEVEIRTRDTLLSIASATTEPKLISAGDEADIIITLENLVGTPVQSVGVSMAFSGTSFTPLGSVSEKRIGLIPSGKSSNISFRVISDPSTESGVYQIPLTLTYSDSVGNNYTKTGIAGLVVDSPPSLDLNIETKEALVGGVTKDIVFSVSNTGPSNVKFLAISALPNDAYTVIGRSKEYLGNLDPDDFETAEFTIYVDSGVSEADFKIRLDYRDAFNREISKIYTVSAPIYTQSELSGFGMGAEGGYNTTLVVVAVLALAYYFYRRRKKKKA